MANISKEIAALIKEKGGINLDIGCGRNKQPGFVGLDIQELEGVDIVHDWNDIPFPLPDESVINAMASHVVEHIPPHNFGFIKFMNEVWRILKFEGRFAITVPYATSPGMYQDPTHCNFCNERTWLYFDPIAANGLFYSFYTPKPWKIIPITPDSPIPFHVDGNMEVLLEKRREDRSYYE